VVLNLCEQQLTNALNELLLPMAVRAVNLGIVYRKATDHIPFDMNTANATSIFHIIKTEAENSEEY
jgi:hypothetical protein